MLESPADGSVSVLIPRALLAGAAALSIDALSLLTATSRALLDAETLANADARVPARVALELWDVLPRVSQKEDFGLWLAELGAGAPLTTAAWFVLSSATLEDGLSRAVRFQRLLHDHADSEFRCSEAGARYVHRVGNAAFRAPQHAIEFGFASLVLLVRRATGRPIVPARVAFQHARPRELAAHTRLFGNEIVFGAASDELWFESATLELPVLTADPALGELVLAHARALLEKLPQEHSTTARVQRLVAAELPANAPSIEAVAQALSLSRRTLQRRLSEEGTSYEQVLEDLRRTLAERYLREQRLSVQDIAFLLGYSDVSAFHRAFSRWTGVSPARFRGQG